MKARVRYVGLVRNAVGRGEEEIELPAEAQVKELLALLQQEHGDELRYSLLRPDGELRSTCHILVGDQDIDELQGLDTLVPPNGEVAVVVLVYPAEGG